MNLSFTHIRNIITLLCLLPLLLVSHSLYAQVLLKGKIIDLQTHQPLIGATIRFKNGSGGTITDENGNYKLQFKGALPQTILVGFVGYQPRELEIYETQVQAEIALRTRQLLSEVVVTAVGIKSTTRSLGYSVGEVKGQTLTDSREPNVVAALSGKVPGVQISNSGGSPGGSASVRIRGNSSLLGNNAPLFILDGVPVDNSVQDILGNITNALSLATPSNRAIDINSEDVASLTVLKGPAAAALYGIRAANGAVIISTKRGSQLTHDKWQVSYTGSITMDERNRRVQPRQQTFTNGLNGTYILPGLPGSDENWGALIDTLTYSNIPSRFDKNGQIVGKSHPASNGQPLNRYNNIDNFFVKGWTRDHNISAYGHTGNAGYYLSYGNLYQTGIIPTTDFYRQTVRLNVDYAVTDRLKITGGINYVQSGANNRALMGGFNTNVVRSLINSPANFDITNGHSDAWRQEDAYKLPPTTAKPWGDSRSYANGRGWDNPYWSLNMNPQKDQTNRFIGFAEASYELRSWLRATFRAGIDNYTDVRKGGFSRGSSGVATGTINDVNYGRRDINTDFILSAQRQLGKNIGLTVILGHNFYNSWRNQVNTRGDGLNVPGNFNIANAATSLTFNQTIRRKLVAGYGDIKLDYKQWLFLELTGRNEWTSTLPQGRNAFFYPSVGSSLVFTEALPLNWGVLNFGKVRATFAEVGNDADPYALQTYYNPTRLSGWIQSSISFPFNNQPGLSLGNQIGELSGVLGNPALKPERIQTWEVGTELHFFKNKTILDAVYYHNTSRDQIIPVSLPASTGALYDLRNAGVIVNRGIEASLQQEVIRRKYFEWNTTLFFAKNISNIAALAEGLNSVSLGGVWMEARAMVGQPYGVFYGLDVKRNEQGEVLIDDNPTAGGKANPNYGYPIVNTAFTRIGDPNPKFNAGWRNEFKLGNVQLSFLLDTRYGFDIFNAPRLQMVFNGVDLSTENRGSTTVFEGITASKGTPNTIPAILSQDWYRRTFDIPGLYVEKNLYWIKLKDINLTYRLPERWTRPAHIQKASLTLTGRNFLLATNYSGSDPDLGMRNGLSNFSGIDFWTTPNTRSYGAAVNIVF
ncbi:SusC/RagA family TonB-linked outer membrane protein [Chitinophaga nivalis]|uniref:SusC/RagA family TonB-linked outer membrane protein n=1 Tax=Chitinophaga nivalis TaxID=2991709 RepID=A0ABT3IEB6_9BACT|nr:SusC/RagA family TonB-linked outer membrane protein [Chitinophaga nivalis]MCW3468003.1 SusC/RagA family TonB-linked outer membrane protein [Chitinophaga nivalis]MCW3482306.1 SusC/RagA family TonB-linked outer membrane protein [Chitinophaga nivalis]